MRDIENLTESAPKRRFRFSLGSVLLWTAIACLTATNFVTMHKLNHLQHELFTHRPLDAAEVARQFQENTTLGPIAVTVKDVRYSPETDSYKIDFSWIDATTSKTWSSDIKLISDGYGTYYGQIRNGPFIQPLGYKESFTVAVKTPSPLVN